MSINKKIKLDSDHDRIGKIATKLSSTVNTLAKNLREHHNSVCHRTRYYFSDYKKFFTKRDAYEYSAQNNYLPIFSVDIDDQSAKKAYIVTGYREWCSRYLRMDVGDRHAYEVIIPDLLSHLYLDVEASLKTNDVTQEEMNTKLKRLLSELSTFMKELYVAPKQYIDNAKLITLDSSRQNKFSKHCIIQIPKTMFQNNYHCGALIRNFQIHIISRYGPPETNPFFIYPENVEKQSPEFKQFMIDMGVYTNGRDFRLLGSSKRANNKGKPPRYLWIENQPNVINSFLLVNTFIQCVIKTNELEYIVSHIPDTINNGIPMSSSLRTITPKNIIHTDSLSGENTGATRVRYSSNSEGTYYPPPKDLVNKIGSYIAHTMGEEIINVKISGKAFFLTANSHECRIKKQVTHSRGAYHSKNAIFYIVFGDSGKIKQSCFNTSYCYSIQQQKHMTYPLGYIKNENILEGLLEWCKQNGWNFHPPREIMVSDVWMGGDSSDEDAEYGSSDGNSL